MTDRDSGPPSERPGPATHELPMNDEQRARAEALDRAMAENEELRQGMAAITNMVKAGLLTLADVGGFSEAELEGGYSAAVAKLESEQPAKCLKILGTLLTLNPRVSKFYRLAGIALHRLKQYELADAYYDIALAFDPEDAISMIYRGETHLLMNKRFTARRLLVEGLKRADAEPELHAIAQRARAIAQALGMPIK